MIHPKIKPVDNQAIGRWLNRPEHHPFFREKSVKVFLSRNPNQMCLNFIIPIFNKNENGLQGRMKNKKFQINNYYHEKCSCHF